ncbi:rod shape-determining protein MreC [Vibrio sp. SS-MA-C1-2]|uniref:rod shape-determining protein MreC n=1 Tax=Vibrio sp. SS-MA-C1-2 TaxID=2908646 RepID=UPI001F20F3A9|nr:rod shape-determining protein MreC [Vibrio sp. SS-MA-C1-2]UJF19150.1 rod shape-determining protein MreC [Vibrio sp. SS-MA-C1-2]
MKPIFGRGPSLQLRLFLAILLSVGLMLADSRLNAFVGIRVYLNTFVAPLQYIANTPRATLDELSNQLSTHKKLLAENQALKIKLLKADSDILLLDQFKQENKRLRDLLDSPIIRDERKMVAEVMAVDTDPYRRLIMINKGYIDDVYEGQPVINEKGVVGQVVKVAAHNSRVLLITDSSHAIPVQIVRNDIRVIASGRGNSEELELEHIPSNADILAGDKLVTSGLGGTFPEGYPVGSVASFSFNSSQPFATVKAVPAVSFDRLRYVLLVWSKDKDQQRAENKVTKEAVSSEVGSQNTLSQVNHTTAVPDINKSEKQ